ncbi:MAG: CocE/NonD family hydrolase [Actinomycetota bacterium]|nr:CocE/NonD family hydrolase [Actinomycetota bacterium]
MPGEPTVPFRRWMDRIGELAQRRVIEVGIPMRDGVELASDVYLPTDATLGAVPAVVEITPYNKDNHALMADDADLWRSNGYVFVAVDVRGRGKSEGVWLPMANDPKDTHDVIEWVAAQPWCDGNVGTTGLSYMGWVQWAGASEHPPHLKAMISTSAAGRWQQEIPFTNGVFQLYFAWWAVATRRRIEESYRVETTDWEAVLRTLPLGALESVIDASGSNWEVLTSHDTLDEFWRSLRFDDQYGEIDVPCLHVTGWYDLEDLLGAFHHYEGMQASPARDDQYLLAGPWSHVKSRYPDRECGGLDFGPDAAVDMDAEHLRWFDHWLKGKDTGLDSVQRVRVFEPGRNAWRGASSWPLSNAERSFYLAPGRLDRSAPEEETSTEYRYDPEDPVITPMDIRRYPFEDVTMEQTAAEAREDVVCFTSEPLDSELTVSGWAALELYAASDGDDTDWHVKLTDVHPDGRSFRVTQGCLRAACRSSLERPEPLVPGETYRFDIELWPTHHIFLPGHRIRVTVTSSDFPWFARSLNRFGHVAELAEPRIARNTLRHGGTHLSCLRLPVEAVSVDGA